MSLRELTSKASQSAVGTKPFSELLAPAIYYADNGFPLSEIIAAGWGSRASLNKFSMHPNTAKTYLIDGHAPRAGEVFRNPDLAKSLRLIADEGRDGFYKGQTARAILQISRELGGTMTAADLAEFRPEWVTPISTTYRGWTVTELPPNTTGIAAIPEFPVCAIRTAVGARINIKDDPNCKRGV